MTPSLLLSGLFAAFTVAFGSTATAEAPASPGAKFLRAGDGEGTFKQASQPKACRVVSNGYEICLDGSDYSLESSLPDGRNRLELYRKSDTEAAAIKSVFHPANETFGLSPDAVDALVASDLFEDGPRGSRDIKRIVFERRTPEGHILQAAVEAIDADGSTVLVFFTVSRQKYGMGYVETTTIFSKGPPSEADLDAAKARHDAFLDRVRVVIRGFGRG